MKGIPFAEGLTLPPDAVTQTFAFLARRGAGKTYGATKLAEGMLELGAQVVALDPVGVWWGLRVAADGKGKGFPIPVFGGLHGDIPLEPASGALVADLVVDRGLSVVLDVSMFRKGDRKRFVTDFAEQVFHRKKEKRSPVHLFVEEAQVFVPQRVQKGEERMLGAFEDIIKLGRNFGIGATLVSQRPQAVNKDALNQTEALFVLQTNGAQERKALEAWIVDQGLPAKELVADLPSLPIGTAYLWSPSWLNKLEKVRIGKKRTFNASATPEVGKGDVEPRELAPVDLEQVRQAMQATIQKAQEEDPKALRRQVAELRGQLAKAGQVRVEEKRVEVQVLSPAVATRLESIAEKVFKHQERADEATRLLAEAFREIAPALKPLKASALVLPITVEARPQVARVARVHTGRERTPSADSPLPKGARDMLTALASTLLPALTKNQVAMLAGLKVTGGTFQKYLSILRTGGHVVDRNGALSITDSGLAAIGGRPPAPASTADLIGLWKTKLPAGARQMLDVLVLIHPATVDREQLASEVGMEVRGGTFQKYLSILRTNGLVEQEQGRLFASSSLFLSGAA
jgi:hypothetical protein